MILVDTSIWIDHLRRADAELSEYLLQAQVLTHPFVIGELALGNLRQRQTILQALDDLPRAIIASDAEVQRFIEDEKLFGAGIGYVDAHLLTSARSTPGATLWTGDRRLRAAAERLSLAGDGSE
ncbi:type II toxin-antitoxin system VapC family toxin [Aurantimonas marianensis]|uniref:Ribonuclease VapC n=1 Tax=Aurantimonas marianensis TaxID=2920428 RepID=A0A9X2H1S2_9HYPH|nr:PIN domain-containing protein [Aurantimonas marianensis]MCP3053677.1 PIN domain-containing protein [Aurantimonas marianensis]